MRRTLMPGRRRDKQPAAIELVMHRAELLAQAA